MKAEIITPEPVEDVLVLTLTLTEARDLRELLGGLSLASVDIILSAYTEEERIEKDDRTYDPLYNILIDKIPMKNLDG